jgi:hypothetical protein
MSHSFALAESVKWFIEPDTSRQRTTSTTGAGLSSAPTGPAANAAVRTARIVAKRSIRSSFLLENVLAGGEDCSFFRSY